jgi:O-antigen/teichoic acid export membrane protein
MTRTPLRQFLRTSGVMALLYAGSAGLTFVVGVVLARLLGVSGYGVYALAMTTAALAGIVTEFGLPVLAMREAGAARADGNWSGLRGLLSWSDRTILALSLLLALLTWAGVQVLAPAARSAYLSTLLWAVALVPFVAIGKLRSFVLLALDKTLASQLPVMILRPLLFLGGCLALWWASGALSPAAAMAAQVGGAAIAMVVILVLFRRACPPELVAASPVTRVRPWLAACLPMGLTEGLRVLQGQLGLVLTGALAGTAQAGLYRVADAALLITALAASIVGTAATPMFARLWSENDQAGLERIAAASAWAMVGGALLLGLPLALFGPWLFPLVFGADFAGSVPVFLVLWLGSLASALFGLTLSVANMTGQHLLSTRSFGVIALVNLAAGAIAIPIAGALGAAAASALASLAGAVYCALALRARTGINATAFNPAMLAMVATRLRVRTKALLKGKMEQDR